MASKKSANPDDLLAQLDDLSTQSKPRTSRPTTARAPKSSQGNQSQTEQDLLAELGNLAQRPSSRPGTPSLKATNKPQPAVSPKRTSTATPPPGRTSEEKTNSDRKSGDSNRSSGQAFTPATTNADESPEPETAPAPVGARSTASGGGWGGWFSSVASAAVSTARARVEDLQKNEEAQKWTESLRGNVDMLRGMASADTIGNLRSMAMPTFQNILQTIAPPISSHERLQIHITHDLTNYPSLDPTIYQVFSRVMAQVEGGDLMVVQRGNEAGPRRDQGTGATSWQDGPWWKAGDNRTMNPVAGLAEGTKLARTGAETFATEFFANKGGLEAAAKEATQTLGENNPTRDSHIFLAIQAITQDLSADLFQGGSSASAQKDEPSTDEKKDEKKEELVFAVYLYDPIHGISFHAISQPVPMHWIDWLDAPGGVSGALPDSIEEIIQGGGVDPREWASEWLEETLSLSIGIIAQRYVARRMGVGEGSAKGKGKLKADMSTASTIEGGGGEAARAMGGM